MQPIILVIALRDDGVMSGTSYTPIMIDTEGAPSRASQLIYGLLNASEKKFIQISSNFAQIASLHCDKDFLETALHRICNENEMSFSGFL
jgi:hypothetical protein